MPCYKPIQGYRSKTTESSGKRKIVFSTQAGFTDQPVQIPCGRCIGCRLERSRQWAMRCVHEATQHQDNCFITLTYNNDNLPENWSLDIEHYQKFMKRLRKHVAKQGEKIKFFHCGEYGETCLKCGKSSKQCSCTTFKPQIGRPHYHAIIFGYDFQDKELIREERGTKLYKSKTLETLWGKGHCSIGAVTFESAAYVARYVLKKITGDAADDHYWKLDIETGESFKVTPEYTTMSRNPGIGKKWYDRFKKDAYPSDFVTIRGKKLKPPKYYDSQLEKESQEEYEKLKAKRRAVAKKHKKDSTMERLDSREIVKQAQLKSLKRTL